MQNGWRGAGDSLYGPTFKIDPNNPHYMECRRLNVAGFEAPFRENFTGRGLPFWVHFGVLGRFWMSSASSEAPGRSEGEFSDQSPFPAAPFLVPSWLPNRAQTDEKSIQKAIKKT